MTEHENDYDDYRQREIKRLLADTIFYLQEASEHPDSIAGIPTGFRDLDRMTGGLQRGDLIVIAGRPGMGKTALAMNIAEAVAIGAREAVALFSLAQPDRVLMLRLLSSLSGIAHDRLRKGDITDEGAREKLALAVRQLVEAPLDINDDLNLTVTDLHAQTRRLQEKRGALGLILIDDLQMIEQDNPGNNRMTTVDRIMRSLKLLAREMYAPVIVLSQVSQRAEQRANKRPLLADLPAAGAIEQHADVVLFIYRSEVYDPDSPERGIADINIAKQRNGPIGTVKLAFQAEYLRFGDLASGYDEAFDD
ncbi:replicative DNA helicase [Cardiobacterium valvarum]|uniref:Putative replicative DNA helicase n=1 Tax=Cardiobacterium valvarum F0432 TaxID=797473 RepID=G9ZGB9_9GAMM|nr:DnaB-like helicase C-terminal domain-containing protein [Cardiobacterium valvarum]EHM53295.1 putative replicative DNA helicase [Cardiobacterium valvarum F0432]